MYSQRQFVIQIEDIFELAPTTTGFREFERMRNQLVSVGTKNINKPQWLGFLINLQSTCKLPFGIQIPIKMFLLDLSRLWLQDTVTFSVLFVNIAQEKIASTYN